MLTIFCYTEARHISIIETVFCFPRTRRDRGRRAAYLRVAGTDVLLSAPRSRPSDVVVLRHQQNASQHPSNCRVNITLFFSVSRAVCDRYTSGLSLVSNLLPQIHVLILYVYEFSCRHFCFCFDNVPPSCVTCLSESATA